MSYAYFAGRNRRARDVGLQAIREMNRETLKHQICEVWLPDIDQPCGCQAVAATLDGRHVCRKHLP